MPQIKGKKVLLGKPLSPGWFSDQPHAAAPGLGGGNEIQVWISSMLSVRFLLSILHHNMEFIRCILQRNQKQKMFVVLCFVFKCLFFLPCHSHLFYDAQRGTSVASTLRTTHTFLVTPALHPTTAWLRPAPPDSSTARHDALRDPSAHGSSMRNSAHTQGLTPLIKNPAAAKLKGCRGY